MSGAKDLSGKAPRPWQFRFWWPQAKALTSAAELTRGRGGWADSPYPLPPASPSPNYQAAQPQVKAWGLQGALWEQWGNTCQTGAGRWLPRRPGRSLLGCGERAPASSQRWGGLGGQGTARHASRSGGLGGWDVQAPHRGAEGAASPSRTPEWGPRVPPQGPRSSAPWAVLCLPRTPLPPRNAGLPAPPSPARRGVCGPRLPSPGSDPAARPGPTRQKGARPAAHFKGPS